MAVLDRLPAVMAATIARVALVAALCLALIAGAFAQLKPSLNGTSGTFSGFNATQFK